MPAALFGSAGAFGASNAVAGVIFDTVSQALGKQR